MTVSQWIAANSELLQFCGLVGTVLLSVHATIKDEKSRQVSNLIAIAGMYKKLWREYRERPELSRIDKPDADLTKQPITDAERSFVHSLIVHLSATYSARKAGMLGPIDGLKPDIRNFFSLPIPKATWEDSRIFQNSDFVRFVDKITDASL